MQVKSSSPPTQLRSNAGLFNKFKLSNKHQSPEKARPSSLLKWKSYDSKLVVNSHLIHVEADFGKGLLTGLSIYHQAMLGSLGCELEKVKPNQRPHLVQALLETPRSNQFFHWNVLILAYLALAFDIVNLPPPQVLVASSEPTKQFSNAALDRNDVHAACPGCHFRSLLPTPTALFFIYFWMSLNLKNFCCTPSTSLSDTPTQVHSPLAPHLDAPSFWHSSLMARFRRVSCHLGKLILIYSNQFIPIATNWSHSVHSSWFDLIPLKVFFVEWNVPLREI